MTRRSLFAKLVPRRQDFAETEKPPAVDARRVNHFVLVMNTYTARLAAGELNLHLWRRVIEAWRDIS